MGGDGARTFESPACRRSAGHRSAGQIGTIESIHWIARIPIATFAETDIRKLRAKGFRPLLLGALSWLFIGIFSLILVELTS